MAVWRGRAGRERVPDAQGLRLLLPKDEWPRCRIKRDARKAGAWECLGRGAPAARGEDALRLACLRLALRFSARGGSAAAGLPLRPPHRRTSRGALAGGHRSCEWRVRIACRSGTGAAPARNAAPGTRQPRECCRAPADAVCLWAPQAHKPRAGLGRFAVIVVSEGEGPCSRLRATSRMLPRVLCGVCNQGAHCILAAVQFRCERIRPNCGGRARRAPRRASSLTSCSRARCLLTPTDGHADGWQSQNQPSWTASALARAPAGVFFASGSAKSV